MEAKQTDQELRLWLARGLLVQGAGLNPGKIEKWWRQDCVVIAPHRGVLPPPQPLLSFSLPPSLSPHVFLW